MLDYLRSVFARHAKGEPGEAAVDVKARHRGRPRGGRVHPASTLSGGTHKADSA